MFDFKISGKSQRKSETKQYDLIVVGGGAAGLTCAIYTSRDSIKTLVLEKEATGGLAASTGLIENYPGFPEGISGLELMEKFHQQAERFGATIQEFEEVTEVEPVRKGLLRVHTTEAVYETKLVLLATGSQPKQLNIPGEKELAGRGVSYCATCDGPLFSGQDVVIIGAGNSGLQEGLSVLNYAQSVTFVEFLPHSPAEKILQDRVMGHEKSTFYFNHQVMEIQGDDQVTGVMMQDRESGEIKKLAASGVFIYVGYSPDTKFLQGLVDLNRWGYIESDAEMWTSVEGIMAAGDVRADNPAQVSIAVGDGAKAALAAREYLAAL
ncbi:MAG TPA: FAD-dependent oxidoreductase [Thermoflexia bacterium]|nr:FAD-dependent oxidoreductase [Thermoflexia bacterium]